MASLSLGAASIAPTVLSMDALGKVAVKLGFASLYLDPAEADELALELQRAAQALRINSSTQAVHRRPERQGRGMSARVFARVHPAGRAVPVTGDEHNVVVDLGNAAWMLTTADARQLAIDLFRAASPAAGAPMAADRAEKHLQVQA